MDADLRILGRMSSINVRKVLWTCDEIGLAYDREDWGRGFASTADPEFLAKNPHGLIPVIEDEAGVLWESNTICRYLAAKHGRTDLLPASPRERAGVEQWMDWQATELNASWRYVFFALVRRDPAFQDKQKIREGADGWNAQMGVLEKRLAETGAFVTGATFTLADVVLGLVVNRWLATPITRPDYPAISAYLERLRERPRFLKYTGDGLP
ncbi:glutathione S-transferase family protein [Hansschlegelia quercus]|uniref:Glutathione S-transferase n=1 Tax=Hansschlegelia quercus TaxID=2528245 RepID=A0A4Q9GJ61_9HYPH|nr:glutathione S-transferase [Hansschlegelia quercus]TBN54108.1 glutathione S-transferase [Hansschlegelia quercus]